MCVSEKVRETDRCNPYCIGHKYELLIDGYLSKEEIKEVKMLITMCCKLVTVKNSGMRRAAYNILEPIISQLYESTRRKVAGRGGVIKIR